MSIDLRTSFPAIVTGLIEEISRETNTEFELSEIKLMIGNKTKWRSEAARELGTTVVTIKRGVNAILFGMDLGIWKRRFGVSDDKRSGRLERLEKEVKEARVLIVNREKQRNPNLQSVKATTILSRAVEATEVEITEGLSNELAKNKWNTTGLIHDELIIKRRPRDEPAKEGQTHFQKAKDEIELLKDLIKRNLREFEEARAWKTGTLGADVSIL